MRDSSAPCMPTTFQRAILSEQVIVYNGLCYRPESVKMIVNVRNRFCQTLNKMKCKLLSKDAYIVVQSATALLSAQRLQLLVDLRFFRFRT